MIDTVFAIAVVAVGMWGILWAVVTLGRAVWFLIDNYCNNK